MGNESSRQEGVKNVSLRTEVSSVGSRRSVGIEKADEAGKQRPDWYRDQIRVPSVNEEVRLQVCTEHDTISSIERKVDHLIQLISENFLEEISNPEDRRQVRAIKPRS